MSKGNKTKGVEILRILKTLYNAGVLSADEQIEFVQLVKKAFWMRTITESLKKS